MFENSNVNISALYNSCEDKACYSSECVLTFLYLLTPFWRVLLEKLTGLQLVKKFPAFHGTRRSITALTSVRHLFLSWANPIQSIYPQPTSWRFVLILSTHLRLGLPSGPFPSGFPTKTLYTPLPAPIRATCLAHLILLDFITRTILGEKYKSFSISLCNLTFLYAGNNIQYVNEQFVSCIHFFLYTSLFIKPYKRKSNGVKSGDLGGQLTVLPRPIHLLGKMHSNPYSQRNIL